MQSATAGGVGGELPAAVAQVLHGDTAGGAVAGAGFLVGAGALVTCAHVVRDAGSGPGGRLWLRFPHLPGAPRVSGEVVADAWRDPDAQDVAVVRLAETPHGGSGLALGAAAGCRGHRVRAFGFPAQAPPDGHHGYAVAGDLLPGTANAAPGLLQLTDANDLTRGFSGAPLMDDVTGLVVGMLTAITAVDRHGRGQSIAYAIPAETLREIRPELTVQDVHPYRGLEQFTEQDAGWFHGRDDAVERVLASLSEHRLLLLLGPSGAGKSSLVRAGVLPAVTAGRLAGSHRWLSVLARPGQDLLAELHRAGLPGAGGNGILAAARARLAGEPDYQRLLLVIDQFEELFTGAGTGRSAAQLAALEQLNAAAVAPAELSIVLVMRDDFYPRLAAAAPRLLEAAAPGLLNMPATLSQPELYAIITRPAEAAGARFEAGLPERIITDVLAVDREAPARQAPVTVLPLLELTLSQLWRDRRDGRLTHETYQRIGGVTGSLASWCDTALQRLPSWLLPVAQRILTALVRPADSAYRVPAVRQQVPLGVLRELAEDPGGRPRAGRRDAPAAGDWVLSALIHDRIVTTRTVRTGEPVAELVHDALIRDWGTLRTWVDQDHQFQSWLRRVDERQARWSSRRRPGDLLRGTDLAEGLGWSRQRQLPSRLTAYLKASRRRQRVVIRRVVQLSLVLAVLLGVAVVATGVAAVQWQTAVANEQKALSRQLAARSDALIATRPDLASLLAVQAYRASPTTEATASLYTAAALPLRRTLPGRAMAFSPDGTTVAIAASPAYLWDIADSEVRTILTDPATSEARAGTQIAFDPDGELLADVRPDGRTFLWNVTTGALQGTLTSDQVDEATQSGWAPPVPRPAFSADGRLLATATPDGTIQLWDPTTAEPHATLTGHTDPVTSIAFSADGNAVASASEDGTVRLWDSATGQARTSFTDNGEPAAVRFSPDGRTLTVASSGDGTARRWDLDTGELTAAFTPDPAAAGYGTDVHAAALGPDVHTLALASGNGIVRLWDIDAGELRATLPGIPLGRPGVSLAFSPGGRILAAASLEQTGPDASGYRVRLWDIGSDRPDVSLTDHTGLARLVEFSPDGDLATVDRTGVVRRWNPATGELIRALDRPPIRLAGPLDKIAFSPDGQTLATTSALRNGDQFRTVPQLRDPTTGAPRHTLTGHEESVYAVAFSPDGSTLATAGQDGTVRLWDTATGAHRATLTGHTGAVFSVAFSPDGHTVAGGGLDATVRLWDLDTGELHTTLTGHTGRVFSLAFSPDGHTLATATADLDRTVRLWDPATGAQRATLTGHTGGVLSMMFSPDGDTLATAGDDGTVRLWDIATGRTHTVFTGHPGWVWSVAFSPDGHTVAAASGGTDDRDGDSAVLLWRVESPDPVAAIRTICTAVQRNLTASERSEYLPSDQEPACGNQ